MRNPNWVYIRNTDTAAQALLAQQPPAPVQHAPTPEEQNNSLAFALASLLQMKMLSGVASGNADEENQQWELRALYRDKLLKKLKAQTGVVASLQALFQNQPVAQTVDEDKVKDAESLAHEFSAHEIQYRLGHAIRQVAADRLGDQTQKKEYEQQRAAFFKLIEEELRHYIVQNGVILMIRLERLLTCNYHNNHCN